MATSERLERTRVYTATEAQGDQKVHSTFPRAPLAGNNVMLRAAASFLNRRTLIWNSSVEKAEGTLFVQECFYRVRRASEKGSDPTKVLSTSSGHTLQSRRHELFCYFDCASALVRE